MVEEIGVGGGQKGLGVRARPDELKQIFWNADEGVTLGDHLSVGFGKVDRRRQVRAFARSQGCRSPAPGILAGQNIVVNGHLLV